ncbi:hypothetical protein KC19_VG027400 [Ceratodon purpureus]|uniref:Uncharacterized protein n=1 Tax=Ceratodon purpureus TaxID=3225 RepID=A0A8T0HLE0_CERPU|nr:hypothetical protein KC19_VG027400 [Ceratodon purpureus]
MRRSKKMVRRWNRQGSKRARHPWKTNEAETLSSVYEAQTMTKETEYARSTLHTAKLFRHDIELSEGGPCTEKSVTMDGKRDRDTEDTRDGKKQHRDDGKCHREGLVAESESSQHSRSVTEKDKPIGPLQIPSRHNLNSNMGPSKCGHGELSAALEKAFKQAVYDDNSLVQYGDFSRSCFHSKRAGSGPVQRAGKCGSCGPPSVISPDETHDFSVFSVYPSRGFAAG